MRDPGERREFVPVTVLEAHPGKRDDARARRHRSLEHLGCQPFAGGRYKADLDAGFAQSKPRIGVRPEFVVAQHDLVARDPREAARDRVRAVAGVTQKRDLVTAGTDECADAFAIPCEVRFDFGEPEDPGSRLPLDDLDQDVARASREHARGRMVEVHDAFPGRDVGARERRRCGQGETSGPGVLTPSEIGGVSIGTDFSIRTRRV